MPPVLFCTGRAPGFRLQWCQRFQMPTAMVTFNGRITLLPVFAATSFPHGLALHFDPVHVVDQPVEDAIGDGRTSDLGMPGGSRQACTLVQMQRVDPRYLKGEISTE